MHLSNVSVRPLAATAALLGTLALGPVSQARADATQGLPACDGEGEVAMVVALAGAVYAQEPGGERRSLACDDVVHACDTVITSEGARVGLLSRDVYAQFDVDTRIQVSVTEDDVPDLRLASGGVRMIDARPVTATPYRLTTPHFSVQGAGGDTELWVRLRGGAVETRLCNHEAPVEIVGAPGGPATAASGTCADGGTGALAFGPGVAPSIDVAEPLSCDFQVALDLTPTDVAAPFLSSFPGVGEAEVFRREPCDIGGCPPDLIPPPIDPPPGPPPGPGSKPIIDVPPVPGDGRPGF